MLPTINESYLFNKLDLIRNMLYVPKVIKVYFLIFLLYLIAKSIKITGVYSHYQKPVMFKVQPGLWRDTVNGMHGACPWGSYILVGDPGKGNKIPAIL